VSEGRKDRDENRKAAEEMGKEEEWSCFHSFALSSPSSLVAFFFLVFVGFHNVPIPCRGDQKTGGCAL
jgi:hypothetical protein